MITRKRIYRFLVAAAVVLTAILVLTPVLAPMFIDMDSVKEMIRSTVNEKTGADIDFKDLALTLLHGPGIIVRDVRFELRQESARGTVEEVLVYPRIMSLIYGAVQINRVSLTSPRVEFSLPHQTSVEGMPLADPDEVRKQTASLLKFLSLHAPGLRIDIDHGSVDISGKKAPISFYGINGSVHFPPDNLEMEVSLSSNLWRAAHISVRVNRDDLSGKSVIIMKGFKLHLIVDSVIPLTKVHIADSLADLKLSLDYDATDMSGVLEGAIQRLLLVRGGEKMAIHDVRFKSDMHFSPGLTKIALTSLVSRGLDLNISGDLKINTVAKDISLDITGRELDVKTAMRAAYFFAGYAKGLRTVFNIVREGKVPLVSFQTRGRSFKDLAEVERLTLKGQLRGGVIFLPWVDLTLTDAGGDFEIEDGVLKGRSIEAHIKSSSGKNGNLMVGLSGRHPALHLDADITADLSEIPPVLGRIAQDETLQRELSMIHDRSGVASARLILDGRVGSLSTEFEAYLSNVKGRYDRIPFPVMIRKSRLLYKNKTLSLRDLEGSIGTTSLSDINADIDWKEVPKINVASGSLSVHLEEVFPWLTSFEVLKKTLTAYAPVEGMLIIDSISARGPITSPKDWKFNIAGSGRNLSSHIPPLGETLNVASGRFSATEDKIAFSDVRASASDASISLRGSVKGYRRAMPEIELGMGGTFGPSSVNRFSEIAGIGPDIVLQSPLTLSGVHLRMNGRNSVLFNGEISSADNSSIAADITIDKDRIAVNKLTVSGRGQKADMSLHIADKKVNISFSGRLEKATIDRFVRFREYEGGWIEGNMDATIDLERAGKDVIHGTIEGYDVPIPSRTHVPLRVKTFSLSGEGDTLLVNNADVSWGDMYLILRGSISSREGGLKIDGHVTADHFTWETLKNTLKTGKEKGSTKDNDQEKSWDLPVTGRIILKADSLAYDMYEMKPFQAEILIDRNHVNVNIDESSVCGIGMKGTLSFTPATISFMFEPSAKNADFRTVLSCIEETDSIITGHFDLTGQITSEGNSDSLLENMKGTLSLTSKDGRIRRMTLLSNILAIVNVTEVFLGKIPDLGKEGLAYNKIFFRGHFENAQFIVDEAILDGKNLGLAGQGHLDLRTRKIDMIVLVAPLKTIDRIIKMIPIVRYILGGTLISVPVSVEGNVNDPEVTVLSPSAIGESVLNLFKRIINLPFKIIEPVLPEKKDQEQH